MNKIKIREPYRLEELVIIVSDAIIAEGLDQNLDYEEMDFCLYTRGGHDEPASTDLICYPEHYPDVNDEDEEIYPDFVVTEKLRFFYSGEQFEDVVHNVLFQKRQPSMEEFIKGLNYYMEHDSFLDL